MSQANDTVPDKTTREHIELDVASQKYITYDIEANGCNPKKEGKSSKKSVLLAGDPGANRRKYCMTLSITASTFNSYYRMTDLHMRGIVVGLSQ